MKQCDFENLFAFVIGREQKIALYELESVLRRFCFSFSLYSLSGNVAIYNINSATSADVASIGETLGGTMKIYKIIGSIENSLSEQIFSEIYKIKSNQGGKINFAISDFTKTKSSKEIDRIGIEIKKALSASGVSARFVSSKEPEVPAILSVGNKLSTKGVEVGVFLPQKSNIKDQNIGNSDLPKASEANIASAKGRSTSGRSEANEASEAILLGKLIFVFDPREWSKRDYDKPAGDKLSGMMPPKLARMMVNIALGNIQNVKYQISNVKNNRNNWELGIGNWELPPLVVDPFCGSGNILMEAKLLGCQIIGSDISEKAVSDTKANLDWLGSNQISNVKYQNDGIINNQDPSEIIFQANATKLNQKSYILPAGRHGKNQKNGISTFSKACEANEANEASAIGRSANSGKSYVVVTEPYLGKPKKFRQKREFLESEIAELKKLYLDFLMNLKNNFESENLAAICTVFPLIETLDAGKVSIFNEVIDEIKKIGYNPKCILEYGREYQVVKREIVLLQINQ